MDHDHTGQIIFCGDGQVTFLYIDVKTYKTRHMVCYGWLCQCFYAGYVCLWSRLKSIFALLGLLEGVTLWL